MFCQSFFLHRFGAHKQFTMSRGWELFFNYLTALTQNSSYLNPRGYAILHRMHHAYSDTEATRIRRCRTRAWSRACSR